MSPGGATMESFFNRIVGRWSEKDRKKKSSLQESNRTGALLNGSAGDTDDPSDMTQQTPTPETKHNERCVDWSRDDDDHGDDVMVRNNAVNEKDTRHTKRYSESHADRKPSFSLFGGRLSKKTRDQPKRFFSQQNLRDEGSNLQGPLSSTPRFAPPKFLARLMSHQKFRSSQDLPSVHEGFRSQDNHRRDSNSRPTTYVPGPVPAPRVTVLGKLLLADVRLGPEGMEGDCCFEAEASSPDAGYQRSTEAARRDEEVKRPSWPGWQEEREDVDDPSHVGRLRQNVVAGQDLSPSGRFLGEYRPRLNTHHEEPTGAVSAENARLRCAGFGPTNRWSLQAPESIRGSLSSLDGTPLDRRNIIEESSKAAVPEVVQFFGSSIASEIDNRARCSGKAKAHERIPCNVDRTREESVLKSYPQGMDGKGLGLVEQRQVSFSNSVLPSHHLKSASYDSGVGKPSRGYDTRKGVRSVDTLPCRFSPNQVQTLRQRSQELYGEYPLTQRKALSNADICDSVGDRRAQMLGTDYRPAVIGRDRVPAVNSSISDAFQAGVGMSQPGNYSGSLNHLEQHGHTRSLSMSQLPQRLGRHPNGFNPCHSNIANKKASPNASGFAWLPGSWRDSGHSQQPAVAHHGRGGSLDSSEQGRPSVDSSVILRPCVEPHNRMGSTVMEEQTSSDPEIVGNFKRRSYGPIERPLRYRLPNRQGSGQGSGHGAGHGGTHGTGHGGGHGSGHVAGLVTGQGGGHGSGHGTGHGAGHETEHGVGHEGDVTSVRRVPQQAVLSLFQKLTLAKQQRMYDSTNGTSINNEWSREQLSIGERPETRGWNNGTQVTMGHNGGIQSNKNLKPQTLTHSNSHVFNDPEQALRSLMRVGHQPYSVTHEESSFNSYEDLRDDLETMNPLHIDESSIDASQFRLDCTRPHQGSHRLSQNVWTGHSSNDLTNQQSPSPLLTKSHFTDSNSDPLDIQLPHQCQNGAIHPHYSNPPLNPLPLPPRSPRLRNYSLDRDGGLALDAEDTYARQLRQEARKLSLSSGSLKTVSSAKRDNIGEDKEDDRDLVDVFHLHPHERRMQREDEVKEDEGEEEEVTNEWLMEEACDASSLNACEFNEIDVSLSSCGQLVDSRDGCAETEKTKANYKFDNNGSKSNNAGRFCDKREVGASIENGCAFRESGRGQNESGRVQNENGCVQDENWRGQNDSGRFQNENEPDYCESGRVQSTGGRAQSQNGRVQNGSGRFQVIQNEPCEVASSHYDTSAFINDTYSKRTGNTSQPILPSTGDVMYTDQPTSGLELRTPDTTNGFPSRLNGSIAPHKGLSCSLSFSEPVHSLRDFPDTDSSPSVEDDSFRGLASVLCRHIGSADEELCAVLRPPYVKASAEFVKQIFENRKVLDLDVKGRLEQPHRTSRTSNQTLKDSKIPNYSLQTLKDELLTLVEKRLKRLQERSHRLCDKQNETFLLEKKVTGIVREKTNSKQFQKFSSYLEQLERVVQLLLNLSIRLSNVEKDLCDIFSEEDSQDKQKKRLTEKRRQILERLSEAMELKSSIDERSRVVSESLGDRLTPQEFTEYKHMVRSRCHVTLKSQEVKDQTEVAFMQRTILFARCQPPLRQTPTGNDVDRTGSDLDQVANEPSPAGFDSSQD